MKMKAINRQSDHDYFAMFLASTPAVADDAELEQFEREEIESIKQAGIVEQRIVSAMKEGRAAVEELITLATKPEGAEATRAVQAARAAQTKLGAITSELNTLPMVYGSFVGAAMTAGIRYMCRFYVLADAEYQSAQAQMTKLQDRRIPIIDRINRINNGTVHANQGRDEQTARAVAELKPYAAEAATLFPRVNFVKMARDVAGTRIKMLGIDNFSTGSDSLTAGVGPAAAAAKAAREEAERRTKEATK